MRHFSKLVVCLLLLIFIVGSFTGCSDNKENVIKVGSKNYTEQLLLGQITLLALEDAGFKVEDKTNIAGSDKVRKALVNGDIDLYWEYTGTAWFVHLQHDKPITNSEEAYQKVKEEDEKNGMKWLTFAPFNNTYALMMRQADSDKLGITTISELAKYVNENPNKFTLASNHEFSIRPDGLPALQDLYGFQIRADNIKIMDPGITYKSLKENKVDVSMGFSTDGRIKAYDLVILNDDKNFFPAYNPAPTVRKEVLEKYPDIEKVLSKIAKELDDQTITSLNYQVDIEEQEPREVAKKWLESRGLIK